MMEKQYKEMNLAAGTTIEKAVNELLEYRKQGQLVSVDFNGVTLFSDTVTMDDAYLKIAGVTKEQLEAEREEKFKKREQELKEHKEKTPDLIKSWIEKGNKIISTEKQKLWAECVPIRLDDLYQGMELGDCLEIVEILNNGGTFEKAKEKIEEQGHSGMSFSLVCSMVKAFADRGEEFVDYIQ